MHAAVQLIEKVPWRFSALTAVLVPDSEKSYILGFLTLSFFHLRHISYCARVKERMPHVHINTYFGKLDHARCYVSQSVWYYDIQVTKILFGS